MKLTFRYPVYPTKTQETTLFQWLDHLCELQNSARHDRKVAWETEGQRVSCNEQQRKLTVAREKYADFREVSQDMQVCALERTDKAFVGFYRRCEAGAAKQVLRRRGIQDTGNGFGLCRGNSVNKRLGINPQVNINVSERILSEKPHGNTTV